MVGLQMMVLLLGRGERSKLKICNLFSFPHSSKRLQLNKMGLLTLPSLRWPPLCVITTTSIHFRRCCCGTKRQNGNNENVKASWEYFHTERKEHSLRDSLKNKKHIKSNFIFITLFQHMLSKVLYIRKHIPKARNHPKINDKNRNKVSF